MRKAKNWLALVLAMFMLFTSFNYDGLTVYAAEVDAEETSVISDEADNTDDAQTEETLDEEQAEEEEILAEEQTADEEMLKDSSNEEFSLSFDANGGTFSAGSSLVRIEYIYNSPGDVSRPGYIFTGWYFDKECTEFCADNVYNLKVEQLSGEDHDTAYRRTYNGKTLYAGWDDNCYTVTFVVGSENGNDPSIDTGYYVKGDVPIQSKKLRTFKESFSKDGDFSYSVNSISYNIKNTDLHYTFEGWYTDEARTEAFDGEYSDNLTLYAKFEKTNYVITVHASTADDFKVAYFDKEIINDNWSDNTKYVAAKCVVPVGSSVSLITIEYDIRYTKTKSKVEALYLSKDLSGEAYTNANPYTPTSDAELWVSWKEDTEGKYVKMDPNGGFFYNSINKATLDELYLDYLNPDNYTSYRYPGYVAYGEYSSGNILLYKKDFKGTLAGWATTPNAKKPDYPIQSQYTTSDWSAVIEKDKAPEAGDTLYAVWTSNNDVVAKFDANGGKIAYEGYNCGAIIFSDDAYYFGEKGYTEYIDVTAERDGYTFNGWYTDKEGTKLLELKGKYLVFDKDITVYAKWIKNHNVKFNVGTGSEQSDSNYVLSVTEGATISTARLSIPSNPTPKNSDEAFVGWCKDSQCTQLLTTEDIKSLKIDEDTTFYAKYAPAYTVTFKAGEGNFVGESGSTYQVKIADGATINGRYPNVDIADEHKIFKGWFDANNKEVDIANYVVTGNVTFTAKYTDCYVVTFHSNKAGVKLDGVAETISVKVPKGESLRYGKSSSDKANLFNAPSIDFDSLADSDELPMVWHNIDYGDMTSSSPSMKDEYVCGYALNPKGTGVQYFLHPKRHLRREYVNGGKTCNNTILSDRGFVPTADTDLYIVWNKKVTVTFDALDLEFNKSFFSNNVYPHATWNVTLSADAKQIYVTVAEGAYFEDVNTFSQAFNYNHGNYLRSVSTWFEDEGLKKEFPIYNVVTKSITLYPEWYDSSSSYNYTNDKRVNLYAGDNGYFETVGKTTEDIYIYSTTYPIELPIPESLDDTKAFNGWYTDAACTKLYNGASQKYLYGKSGVLINTKVNNLYAGYGEAKHVQFDANGGYFDEDINRTKNPSEELKSDSKLTVKEKWVGKGIDLSEINGRIRRDGDKVFAGWYTDAACTKKAAITTEVEEKQYFIPTASETTLYAKWIDYTQPTKIKLTSKDYYNISIGQKVTLSAETTPADGEVKWYLDNTYSKDKNQKNPVRLTEDGVVTGLAAGTASIHAEFNGLITELVAITVANKQVGTSIELPTDKLTLVKDQVVNVNAEITPETAKLTWKTSNADVAAIEANGTSVAIKGGKNGTATITAAIGTVKKTVTVTVVDPILLSAENIGITALTSMHGELEAILADEDATVTWTSSDESIATVAADSADSKKAVVTPAATFNTEKTVTITAEASIAGQTYSKDCAVVLYPVPSIAAPYAVDGISLEGETATDVRFGTKVRFVAASHGANIYYTTSDADNAMPADPTASSAKYTDAIELTDAMINSAAANQIVIKAIAIINDNGVEIKSPVVTFTYQMKDADSDWGDIIQEDRAQWNNKATNVTNTIWLADASVAEVKTYTGKAQTFANLRVYYGKTLLVEKKDYTVKYANNVNAAESTAVKAPTVTITGKDKYTGSFKKTFTINKYAYDGNDNIIAVANSYNYPSTKSGVKLSGLTVYAMDTATHARTKLAASTYTVTYADEGSDKLTASTGSKVATITMKGNYEGTLTVSYTVYDATKSISKLANINLKLNNKAVTKAAWNADGVNPDLVVTTKKNEPLTIGEDYKVSVSYNGNGYAPFGEPNVFEKEYVSADDAISLKSVGKYTITISGIGEYTGEITKTFDVTGKNLTVKDFTVSDTKIATETPYTGEKVYPTFKVFDGKTDITGNTEAYIDAMEVDAIEVGTYTFSIYGKCDAGYNYAPIRKTFKITGEKLVAGRVKPTVSSFVYDGQNITLEDINVVVTNAAKSELAADVDYTAALYDTYKNATNNKALTANVGTKKLVITGIGKYTGTITKDIKVTQADIAKLAEGRTVTATVADASVLKGGAKPVVTVTDSLISENLVLGKDYKVAYTNNKVIATVDAKKAPTATITFTGNYKGKLTAKFNISAGTISDAKITAVDIAAAKFNPSNLKATLVGTDGVKLAANTDYKLKYYYNAGVAGIEYKRGKQTYTAFGQSVEVQKNDELTAGTEILIVAEGIKNFEGQCQTVARVFAKNHDISKATITIAPQTYTGSQIILTEEDITKHVMNKMDLVYGQDYIIDETSYVNNTAKGNAKVTFKGIGEYAGTKTVEFKIVAKTMN